MTVKERFLNKERSWTDILPLVFVQAYLWMNAGGILSHLIQADKWSRLFVNRIKIATDMGDYMFSIGFWAAMIAALVIFRKNRPLLRVLCPERKIRILTGSVIGLVLGFALNASVIAGAVLTGCLTLTPANVKPLTVIGYLIAIFFQAGGEELICRMYIMGKLRRRYKSPAVAIAGNALFFLIFHLGNPGINAASIINILAAGIMFSLIVYYSENIWTAIGLHTAWNFTQVVLFGLPNSGVASVYSVFKVEQACDGFFFDSGFGVEGSWAATLLLCIVAAGIVVFAKTGRKGLSNRSDSRLDCSAV